MKPKVALVSMPWAPISEPSLALGILKAQLTQAGIESRVFHSSLGLLRHVTGTAYQQVSACWALNEFTFTGVFDQQLTSEQIGCLMERCFAHTDTDEALPFKDAHTLGQALIEMRHQSVPQYLAECAEDILAYEPTLVGFTCMFDQTIASAALALLLRQELPNALIVLGGYALEGPPGHMVLRAFPHIDAVALGDGEPVIVPLAHASTGGIDLRSIPGVLTREPSAAVSKPSFQLEDSPEPDYSDWYADIAALEQQDHVSVRTTVLPIESSRGCWWGQKQHCVFCGIDKVTLSYRTKKAGTVLTLLDNMRKRYGAETPFRFSDYILPHNFITELLPKLAEVEPRYTLHCEIKANQNEERIKAFAAAGFSELQPGIESFDSNVLKLMKKGVTGIQNVHLLKLGYLHGIQINYNILYGVPNERPEWYLAMIEQMPRLYHFTPPVTRTETVVTRFAPMQTTPSMFGSDATPRHHRCYDVLFSQAYLQRSGFSYDEYAYYFDRYFNYNPETLGLYSLLVHEVDCWKKQHREREVVLAWERTDNGLRIRDTRFSQCEEHLLEGWLSEIYLACDRAPQPLDALSRETGLSLEEVRDGVAQLDRARLVWLEDDRVLGLATPESVVAAHRETAWQQNWTALYC